MVDTTIFRQQTEAEKKDYKLVGSKDINTIFRQSLIAEEQKHVKEHKAFCFRCAKMDFQDRFDAIMRELERKGNVNKSISMEEIGIDVTKYGESDKFELIDKKEVVADKLLDGIRTPVKVGIDENYVCKKRNCKITVFVPFERQQPIK